MKVARAAVVFIAILLGSTACTEVGLQQTALELRVERRLDSDTDQQLAYRFELANNGTDVVWLPNCGQVVSPDIGIEVGGREVDRLDGTTCDALLDSRPVTLVPGGSIGGLRVVPRRTGARYVPTLRYSARSDLSALRRIGAAAFAAP